MGSLTSRPKAPTQVPQQVVYMPSAPAPTYNPPATYTPPASDNPSETPDAEERQAQSRTQNLLTRERSRYGTVNTSFRGLLGLAATDGRGKTLLGE